MKVFLIIVGVAFTATLVLGIVLDIINKDDNVDMDYLEDC